MAVLELKIVPTTGIASYEITQDPFLEVESTTGSSAGFLAAGVAGVSIPE